MLIRLPPAALRSARYVRDLRERPSRRGVNVVALDSGVGLANATLQQRLVAVRLFYDHLVEEGKRETNPVGRGRYTPGRPVSNHRERGLVPRLTKLPWIPTDAQWRELLRVTSTDPLRNRLMLAMAYDAGLRREELCSLRTDDLDPAYRTLRVRAETTKGAANASCRTPPPLERCYRPIFVIACLEYGARAALPLNFASQPSAANQFVDLVQGRASARFAGWAASFQYAHATSSVPDRSGAGRLGVARHCHLRRSPQPRYHAPIYPFVGSRSGGQAGPRHGRSARVAHRADQ